jgi:hypothetical protein
MTANLPDPSRVDSDAITEPTMTTAGLVVPSGESIEGLARLRGRMHAQNRNSGPWRSLWEEADALATRLRAKHAGDAAKLAQIDELTAA